MDVNDTGLLEWAFKGLVSIVLTVGAWLWVMLLGRVEKNREEIQSHRNDFAEHKLEVAKTYATKEDVNQNMGEIKDTVKRMHERIDKLPGDILNLFQQMKK